MRLKFVLSGMIFGFVVGYSQSVINYKAEAIGNGSTGDFAPYFIGSLNGGRIVRQCEALADLSVIVPTDNAKRFSWGAGAEILTGYSTANHYERWYAAEQEFGLQTNRPSAIWIQQLYGEIRYRGLFLRLGQKDYKSSLLDERLSSGDLTRSGNARGIPGFEAGFNDFQNVPFTNGWVQIDGVLEYGKFTDDGFNRKQYNYYNYMLATGVYYTYKRLYLRSNPEKPFGVLLGMQSAGQFGGTTVYYDKGIETRREVRGFRFKDVFKMLIPVEGNGNFFYEGNTLGSWDLKANYRFKDNSEITFAFQGPWEEGHGISRKNGWDGLWGLYYHSGHPGLIEGAAVEWLDFRNHSGPIHYEENDYYNPTLEAHSAGGNDYYNNGTYMAYANYGMAIATPFLVSPIYNLNGFPAFMHNRARGLHLAVRGSVFDTGLNYAVKYSWQQGWGMGRIPQSYSMVDNSMLFDVTWDASRILSGFSVRGQIAFDCGSLRGNNFGVMLGVTYSGSFRFKNK